MRIFGYLIILLASVTSLSAQQSTEKVFQEILARHQEVKSYFAVYEGDAPGGKSLNAAISFHGPGKIASVQLQLLIDGKVVAQPFQAVAPDLGLIVGGSKTLQLKDTQVILEKLVNVLTSFFETDAPPIEAWRASLFMSADSMNARLGFPVSLSMPWVDIKLPEGTTHSVDGELTIFTTPNGSVSHVQTATGILKYQNFPNEEGDRTLVLKQLQTDLSEEEIFEFTRVSTPPT